MRHAHAFLAAVRRSRALHGSWVHPPSTLPQYRVYLQRLRQPNRLGFFVCTPDGALAGVIHISEIVRGAFNSGFLGYYGLSPYERCGYMRAGLAATIRHAFGPLRLHRVEANIQPENAASIGLVQSLGFRREGYSPRYLKIAGRWRDHERWALTREDWQARRRGSARRR